MKNKFAFTLAETMIVLVVIGVLSAVLIPVALNNTPDKNLMKFKNGYNNLGNIVRELVNSDKYYLEGDLGTKSDGTVLSEHATTPWHQQYFCQTFADVAATKYIDCETLIDGTGGSLTVSLMECSSSSYAEQIANCNGKEVSAEYIANRKEAVDRGCQQKPFDYGVTQKQIITTNDIWYYDPSPKTTFGIKTGGERLFSPPNQNPPTFYNNFGMDYKYKVFCMDIDGVPENATKEDCVNECPFGFGIRADGKIFTGARADEWLEKSMQEK
ncbi:MAG: prepilin-type N-terminal cleavage/methylation domain-containing protein [Candidatus Gastranaerophilales bacterium]|nr:prepilin-type N-terminal cleavage/methylation domain-containing protein [Candidatus Gastranaerophilales bacterium]